MNGTEKQVKWAFEIRRKFVAEMLAKASRLKASPEQIAQSEEVLNATCDVYSDAKWWIENRNNVLSAIKETYLSKVKEMGYE